MKYVFQILTCLTFQYLFAQEVHISGSIPSEIASLEIISFNTPLDDNLIHLASVKIENGSFEQVLDLNESRTIIFQSDNFNHRMLVHPGVRYSIEFADELRVANVSADDPVTNQVIQIERGIYRVQQANVKANGRYTSKYASKLFEYLDREVLSSNDTKLIQAFANSNALSDPLYYLANYGNPEQYEKLNICFAENIEYSFASMNTIKNVHRVKIIFDFFQKNKQKQNYFDFIDSQLSTVSSGKFKNALELTLVSSAMGRKWANQTIAKERLEKVIAANKGTLPGDYASEIFQFYEKSIIGTQLQNFELNNLEGELVSFEDFKGKYLLIDFWATWCGPCIKSMKKLPALKADLQTNLQILCISTEIQIDKMKSFVKRNNYDESMSYAYPRNNNKELRSYFNKRAIPLYFLVSPEGIILDKSVGDPEEMIRKHIN